jgi:hypothetical protein
VVFEVRAEEKAEAGDVDVDAARSRSRMILKSL